MIYVVGDSHVNLFTGNIEMMESYPSYTVNGIYKCYRLGALTATALYLSKDKINQILFDVDKQNDFILFSFGEVDCRAHLSKAIFTQNKPYKIIGPCVDEYFKVILKVCQKGYKVGLIGVPPSHNGDRNHDVTYGTIYERNYISRIWNNYLQSLCDKYHLPFVCVFDEILKDDGSTDPKYMDGWVHLNRRCWPFMEEELKINGII
jgi:hypothetical protein